MKRDMDLIRELLLKSKEVPPKASWKVIGYDEGQRRG
jgi:hypothetical protein